MSNRILKKCLGLDGAVVEGARIEGESIIVSAPARKHLLRSRLGRLYAG